jgi:hypothetical protein
MIQVGGPVSRDARCTLIHGACCREVGEGYVCYDSQQTSLYKIIRVVSASIHKTNEQTTDQGKYKLNYLGFIFPALAGVMIHATSPLGLSAGDHFSALLHPKPYRPPQL